MLRVAPWCPTCGDCHHCSLLLGLQLSWRVKAPAGLVLAHRVVATPTPGHPWAFIRHMGAVPKWQTCVWREGWGGVLREVIRCSAYARALMHTFVSVCGVAGEVRTRLVRVAVRVRACVRACLRWCTRMWMPPRACCVNRPDPLFMQRRYFFLLRLIVHRALHRHTQLFGAINKEIRELRVMGSRKSYRCRSWVLMLDM